MAALQELTKLRDRLANQLSDLQAEIAALDKTLSVLAREDGRKPIAAITEVRYGSTGLSEAIRQIVDGVWISPVEVRDSLIVGGYPNTDKTKLLSSVATTMKRLGGSELETKKIDGKAHYRRLRKSVSRQSTLNMEETGQQHVDNNGTDIELNKPSGSRKMQMHQWLKQHGPSTRKSIVDGTGIPDGTVGSYLGTDSELFGKRDGLWLAQ